MLGAILPLRVADFERARTLARSLEASAGFASDFVVILDTKENTWIERVRTLFRHHNPQVIFEEEILPRGSESAWCYQQRLKLAIARKIKGDHYLVLDADVIATRPVQTHDLVRGGRGVFQTMPPGVDKRQDAWYRNAVARWQTLARGDVPGVTPQVLSTHIVREMWGNLPSSFVDVTEYTLYYAWACDRGFDSYHVRGTLCANAVWYPHQMYDWTPTSDVPFTVYQSNIGVPPDVARLHALPHKSPSVLPLVSCLMVSRGDLRKVKQAVAYFRAQTYPQKELVIVMDANAETESFLRAEDLPYILAQPGQTLGDLRNVSLARAKGPCVIQWDDDDIYHPARIAAMYRWLKRSSADACFLSCWFMAWPSARKYVLSGYRKEGWEGSMIAYREKIPPYPSLSAAEDTAMVREFTRRGGRSKILDWNYAYLYIYTVHGNNTCSNNHFTRIFSDGKDIGDVLPFEPEAWAQNIAQKMGVEYSGWTSSNTGTNEMLMGASFLVLALIVILALILAAR